MRPLARPGRPGRRGGALPRHPAGDHEERPAARHPRPGAAAAPGDGGLLQPAGDDPHRGRPALDRLSPAERQALVGAFSDWSIATYASRFDGYGGESFETLGETTRPNGDRLVSTRLNRPNDAPVLLNYLLRDGGRIVDIYLTGTVSELASRRAEFTAVLREGGPGAAGGRAAAADRGAAARLTAPGLAGCFHPWPSQA